LSTAPLLFLKMLATGLAAGILIDAFIVRRGRGVAGVVVALAHAAEDEHLVFDRQSEQELPRR
jgi:hypothetical protein